MAYLKMETYLNGNNHEGNCSKLINTPPVIRKRMKISATPRLATAKMGIQEEIIKQRAAAASMERMTVAVKRNQCSKPLFLQGGREGGREEGREGVESADWTEENHVR
jgi:hypothetical protein